MMSNIFLQIGIWEYVLYAIGIIVVTKILSRLLPIASIFLNIAIVIGAVYYMFKNTHWLTALKATGILALFLVISWIVTAMRKPAGPTSTIRYIGRDENGKPKYEINTIMPTSSAQSKRYVGKDENGNDKFEVTY